jgi:hypothetical protein
LTTALLIAVVVLLAVSIALDVLWRWHRLVDVPVVDGIETAVDHLVLVHTTDEQSVRGVLAGVHSDGSYELRDAEFIVGRETHEVGGELYVMRSNIARIQRVGRNGSA